MPPSPKKILYIGFIQISQNTGTFKFLNYKYWPWNFQDMLCNIGSSGACASGASSGIVVASPDKVNPNCGFLISFQETSLTLSRFLYMDTWLRSHFQVYSRYIRQQLFCVPSDWDWELYQLTSLSSDCLEPVRRSFQWWSGRAEVQRWWNGLYRILGSTAERWTCSSCYCFDHILQMADQ